MMRIFRRLASNSEGAAAAEMAMTLPIFLILFFACFELGYYFFSEHLVQKSVRDAARYAGRLPSSNFDCSSSTVNATAVQQIQRVAKAGDPDGDWNNDGTQDQRLGGWTADTMTIVTLACDTDTTHLYVNKGIFIDFPNGVPVVTVRAVVPYPTLFNRIGLGTATLNLNAQSQAAVFGA